MMASAPPMQRTQLKKAAHCTPRLCHCMTSQTATARATARSIQGHFGMVWQSYIGPGREGNTRPREPASDDVE